MQLEIDLMTSTRNSQRRSPTTAQMQRGLPRLLEVPPTVKRDKQTVAPADTARTEVSRYMKAEYERHSTDKKLKRQIKTTNLQHICAVASR